MHDGVKSLKWGMIGMAAIYIILGVILIVWPESSARTLCDLVGSGIFIGGAICFISFFIRSSRMAQMRNQFVVGLILMLVGLVIVLKADVVVAAIPFILGILIVVSGLKKVQDGLTLKKITADSWKVILILGVINILFGLILILNAGTAARVLFILIGVGLVFNGGCDLFTTLYVSSKLK